MVKNILREKYIVLISLNKICINKFKLKSFCNSVSQLSRGNIGPNDGNKIKIIDWLKSFILL